MANESLFAFATNYAEARAKALGGNIVKGAAAFEVEDAPDVTCRKPSSILGIRLSFLLLLIQNNGFVLR